MHRMLCVTLLLLPASAAWGKIVTETIDYRHGDVELQGYLAYDDATDKPRPAVIVVHEWWGLNDFARQQARELAEHGYVAFALDMYGKGKVTTDPQQAGQWAGQFSQDESLRQSRAAAGFHQLREHKLVDKNNIAAIGFCFGGTTVLQMAYAGLPLKGVVSFHGGLKPLREADAGRVRAAVLILHGDADSLVPESAVNQTVDSFREGNLNWTFIRFAGAKHSFTNPKSDDLKMDGVGYDPQADQLSHRFMYDFLELRFSK